MPGLGHGFGFGGGRKVAAARAAPPPPNAVALISPSPAWTGTASTGFTALPADPVRTTAKPACLPIVPPHQWFTDELLVGVYAGASFNGSLVDNMGLERVVAHYEGTSFDITAPSFQTFPDTNGTPVTYFGWWIRLKRDGRNGTANLWFEAVPKDTAMQRRVIGPYPYHPRATAHDQTITIAPSLPQVAGSRYQSLSAALTYLQGVSAQNPLVTFTEPGSFPMNGGNNLYFPAAWCTITATVPVTLTASTGLTYMRPKTNGVRFRGANITIDYASGYEILKETANTRDHWLDGCKLINSNGRYDVLGGSVRNGIPWIVRGAPWFTECTFDRVWSLGPDANLMRGCTATGCWADVSNQPGILIGNRIDDHDSTVYRNEISAISVTYTGAEAAATLALSGVNNSNNRIMTAAWGANVATLAMSTAVATTPASYWPADIVNWLNTLPGWSATLLDDSRRAAALMKPGQGDGGAFGATSVKNTTFTLATMFDIHADFWQKGNSGGVAYENRIVADNTVTGFVGQNLFIQGDSPMRDMLIVNNAFHNKTGTSNPPNVASFSQSARPHSHVVVAHNSFASQGWLLRLDQTFNPDARCLFANNSVRSITWVGAGTDADIVIANNHLHVGQIVPAGASGTSTGGDHASLYLDAAGGDFTPAGALLTNKRHPVMKYDINRAPRGNNAPVGAVK